MVARFELLVCLGLLACQGHDARPSPSDLVHTDPSSEPDQPDAGVIVGPDAGCGEVSGDFCGQVFLREVDDPPNVYFVVDRSGSMGGTFEGSRLSKFQTARATIADLLRSIGHRIRYGAAAFPSKSAPDTCSAGQEIFPTVRGDPAACAANGRNGPVLTDLSSRLATFAPAGATPTAATLEALRPTLTSLGGRTFVILITDGAPNCNFDAQCDTGSCTLNIEGASIDGVACTDAYNCCDPMNTGDGAGGYCIDDTATEAAAASLADDGIPTYVVGMPGAEPYSAALDRLAEAGGTAREVEPKYYSVGDADALREALFAIGTGIAISCSIDLEAAPDDPARVNVYFDGEVVPGDDEDGWAWDGENHIEVRGAACERLRSGEVREARVVFGCDTVVR